MSLAGCMHSPLLVVGGQGDRTCFTEKSSWLFGWAIVHCSQLAVHCCGRVVLTELQSVPQSEGSHFRLIHFDPLDPQPLTPIAAAQEQEAYRNLPRSLGISGDVLPKISALAQRAYSREGVAQDNMTTRGALLH